MAEHALDVRPQSLQRLPVVRSAQPPQRTVTMTSTGHELCDPPPPPPMPGELDKLGEIKAGERERENGRYNDIVSS